MKRTAIKRGVPLARRKRMNQRAKKLRPGRISELDYAVLREAVLGRDGFQCRNCGGWADVFPLAPHHIIFRSHGGPDTAENLITLCNYCHAGIHAGKLFIIGDANTAQFTTINPRRN